MTKATFIGAQAGFSVTQTGRVFEVQSFGKTYAHDLSKRDLYNIQMQPLDDGTGVFIMVMFLDGGFSFFGRWNHPADAGVVAAAILEAGMDR